ncbi:GvpT/GvpP family gas vesicle accessory protein [Bacillus sp. RAR_GA_16]|uniref:GvpT/GvpP family gas vesicle accessory protein n=1 Tax=Bacillus sp. RAR_GA_16 TaxID=2876774 RepID=UPI001CCF88FF|nr:GvpT/GvpP family gas vesicle accessory protein [Bacillus sp. RAR_GA_16]MCA0170422.1 gas vesicle protein GvpP [Bacillus sp. RAR_GA_16]
MSENEVNHTSGKILSQPSNGEQEETNERSSMNLAIIGGVVGAGVGLLSSPGTGKKVLDSIGKSEAVRNAGQELRRSAQEFITEQALITLRQTATGYMSKYEGRLLPGSKKGNSEQQQANDEVAASSSNEEIDEIKEENKQLNQRLDRIENMLSSLVDSK